MSDTNETSTPSPWAARAAFIAAEPSATFESVYAEGPGVMAELKENYPDRYNALFAAHTNWQRAGRPASGIRTAPVQTAPAPRPAPVAPQVAAPDPAGIATMRDLTRLGATAFNAFKAQHPDRFDELARAVGITPSRP